MKKDSPTVKVSVKELVKKDENLLNDCNVPTKIHEKIDDLIMSGTMSVNSAKIPTLSTFQLCYWATRGDVLSAEPKFSEAIINMTSYFHSTGENFEDLYTWWEITMRFVRQKLARIFPNDTTHPWKRAQLTQVYCGAQYNLDPKIQILQFDFTLPLEIGWFRDITELAGKTSEELTAHIWVPENPNNPGFDCLLFFSTNTETYVVAIENKYTREGNTTVINYQKDIVEKRANSIHQLSAAGYDENNMIFVLMARRPSPASPCILPRNTIMFEKKLV